MTGPFAVNGVPLRRVNSAYVIGTSTTVDVSEASTPSKLDDATFKAAEEKAKKRTSKRGEGEAFFAEADAAAKANEEGHLAGVFGGAEGRRRGDQARRRPQGLPGGDVQPQCRGQASPAQVLTSW